MIKRLIAAYRLIKEAQHYVAMADRSEFWTDGNSQVATSFFNQDTGKRLMIRLRNAMFTASMRACNVPSNGDYARGKANGIMAAIEVIEQHLTPAPSASAAPSELETDEQAIL
jgi:hypothetical protein